MSRTSAASHAILLAAISLLVWLPAAARAAPSAKLSAAFTPLRLGHRTTLGFGFRLSAPADQLVPALTEIDLRYPGNLGIALSGLGLARCSATTLQASGPTACPANSIMGYGSALAEIPLSTEATRVSAQITILRAPTQEGRLALLFDASSPAPVIAHVVFGGSLLPAGVPFGGRVSIGVPLVPTIPGAPDLLVVQVHVTLGPLGVSYYERVGAMTLAYRPKGILLPKSCPRGGFPFAAEFSFVDGSHTQAYTAVPCPARTAARTVRRRSHTRRPGTCTGRASAACGAVSPKRSPR